MDISSNPGVPSLAEGLGSPPLHSTSSTPEEINLPTPSDPSLGLRRSSRLRNMSDKPLPQLSAIAEEFIPPVHVPVSFCPPIELTFNSVMASHNPERDDWLLAMKDEMASIEGHGTWILTKPVPGKKVMSGRWIFTRKMGTSGQVEWYKARFVVKGFMQRPGLEFQEVYAPVTSKDTLRFMIAALVSRKMFVRQLDIKTS